MAPTVAGHLLLLGAAWALQDCVTKSTVAQGPDWIGQAREEVADTVVAAPIHVCDARRILLRVIRSTWTAAYRDKKVGQHHRRCLCRPVSMCWMLSFPVFSANRMLRYYR